MCPLYKAEVLKGRRGWAKFAKRAIRGGKVAVEAGAALSVAGEMQLAFKMKLHPLKRQPARR